MNRIDRVSAILIQLQSRKIVKAQHIADRFNISLRTVYRDIKSLEEAGIPLSGEAGVGYSLMEGYRLPPVMFTREEAISFLTAEKLVEKLTDKTNGRNYKSAMYKVRAVLRSSEKDLLEQIDEQVQVLRVNRQSAAEGNFTEIILKAIAERRVLSLDYFSFHRQQSTAREVEPVGIFHLEQHWHLIAFCLLRNDYRDFRFDRIGSLRLCERLQVREHPPLKEYIERKFAERRLHPVTIAIDKGSHPYLSEQKYFMGFVDERVVGDEVEVDFLTSSIEGFARWFVLMADHARIVAPEELKVYVRRFVEKISARLQ